MICDWLSHHIVIHKILVVTSKIGPIFKAKFCHFYHETIGCNSTLFVGFPPNPNSVIVLH